MNTFIEICDHHIGASHIKNGLQCEDYAEKYSDEGVSIAVISDGHGDKNCFRSSRGAIIACEVAIALCRNLCTDVASLEYTNDCQIDELLTTLKKNIIEEWTKRVLTDANENPFCADEMETASEQAKSMYLTGKRLEKAYGCTLVVAAITETYWFGLQIGDGRCVSVYSDGVFAEPIPVDEDNCLGNHSSSLCNSNAADLFRHYYSIVLPQAIFVVSDGVEESFDQMGLYNCFYSIVFWILKDGIETAKTKMNDLLPQISEGGSGDDVSLSAVIDTAKDYERPKQTLGQVYERIKVCNDVVIRCGDMLRSAVKEKKEYDNTIAERENEITVLEEKIKNIREEIEKNRYNRSQKQEEIDELAIKEEKAKEQLDKVVNYKKSAEMFWRKKYDSLQLTYDFGEELKLSEQTVSKSKNATVDIPDQVKEEPSIVETIGDDEPFSVSEAEPTNSKDKTLAENASDDMSNESNYSSLSFDELISVYNPSSAIGTDIGVSNSEDFDDKKEWSIFKRGTKSERR
jgi:Skp family chaperone for outer membrane proteins